MQTYAYDTNNQVFAVSNGAGQTFDGLGRVASVSANGTTRFLYDGERAIAEYGSNGAVLRRYVFGPAADEPLVWYEGAGTATRYGLTADRLGSITAVTNDGGAAAAIDSYDEYGLPGANNVGRFQFTGQMYMSEFGWYNYKARNYSPTLGRFVQPDPTGYADGADFYNYVHLDPVNGYDPSGLLDLTLCHVTGGTTSQEGDTTVVTASRSCSTVSYPDPPQVGGGALGGGGSAGSAGSGSGSTTSVMQQNMPRPMLKCLGEAAQAAAETAIKGGTYTTMAGGAFEAAAAGAEVVGGGPEDPLADGAAYFSGRTGNGLVKAGTATVAGASAFLLAHGRPQEAVNAGIEAVLDLVDKAFIPESGQPYFDKLVDVGLNVVESRAGLLRDAPCGK